MKAPTFRDIPLSEARTYKYPTRLKATSETTTIPLMEYRGNHFIPLSFMDNRVATHLAEFDPKTKEYIKGWILVGARYISSHSYDAATNTVTFTGQAARTVSTAIDLLTAQNEDPAFSMIPAATAAATYSFPNKLKATSTETSLPLMHYRGNHFIALSFIDNRVATYLAEFNPTTGEFIQGWIQNGARYVHNYAYTGSTTIVTFKGQSSDIAVDLTTLLTDDQDPAFSTVTTTVASQYALPSGTKATSLTSTIPLMHYKGKTLIPLSYIDNRVSTFLAEFNPATKAYIRGWEYTGARYIGDYTYTGTTDIVTFIGQSARTINVDINSL